MSEFQCSSPIDIMDKNHNIHNNNDAYFLIDPKPLLLETSPILTSAAGIRSKAAPLDSEVVTTTRTQQTCLTSAEKQQTTAITCTTTTTSHYVTAPNTIATTISHMNSTKRKRFDSNSTAACSPYSLSEQCQLDSRFEAKMLSDTIEVKKSVLSCSQLTPTITPTTPPPMTSSIRISTLTSAAAAATAATTTSSTCSITPISSLLSFSSQSLLAPYSIILCIQKPRKNSYSSNNNNINNNSNIASPTTPTNINNNNNNNLRVDYEESKYITFPEVEMVLDNEKTVDTLIYDIVEAMNEKFTADLQALYPNLRMPASLLTIGPTALLHGHLEIAQASKSNQPKGCSFDMSQVFGKINCKKSKLALKVTSASVYDSLLFKLVDSYNAKPKTPKKYDVGVQPIQEIEDDTASIAARHTSTYKDSLIHAESIFENQMNHSKQLHVNTQRSSLSSSISSAAAAVASASSAKTPSRHGSGSSSSASVSASGSSAGRHSSFAISTNSISITPPPKLAHQSKSSPANYDEIPIESSHSPSKSPTKKKSFWRRLFHCTPSQE